MLSSSREQLLAFRSSSHNLKAHFTVDLLQGPVEANGRVVIKGGIQHLGWGLKPLSWRLLWVKNQLMCREFPRIIIAVQFVLNDLVL